MKMDGIYPAALSIAPLLRRFYISRGSSFHPPNSFGIYQITLQLRQDLHLKSGQKSK